MGKSGGRACMRPHEVCLGLSTDNRRHLSCSIPLKARRAPGKDTFSAPKGRELVLSALQKTPSTDLCPWSFSTRIFGNTPPLDRLCPFSTLSFWLETLYHSWSHCGGQHSLSTHLGQLITTCSLSSRGHDALFWPPQILQPHVHSPHVQIIKT